jgi:hypothetical protein
MGGKEQDEGGVWGGNAPTHLKVLQNNYTTIETI